MNIVKFRNSRYGIRKGWLKPFYRYLDFNSDSRGYIRWRKKTYDFINSHCSRDFDTAMEVMILLNDYGIIVKEELNSGE